MVNETDLDSVLDSVGDFVENATEFLEQNATDFFGQLFNASENEALTIPPPTADSSSDSDSNQYYILIYTGFMIATIALTILRSWIFFEICMNASKNLHNTMFGNILQATMRFFDTNPSGNKVIANFKTLLNDFGFVLSGRILNRFSKDIGAVDELLPKAFLEAIQIFMVMSGILIMVFIVSPWMIVPTVFLAGFMFMVRKVYLSSAQDVKRLEGISKNSACYFRQVSTTCVSAKAPVFSHVAASISGLTTIRASRAEAMVIKEFDLLQDQHTATWVLFIATTEWFGFYLDVISVTFLAILAFQFLIFDNGKCLHVLHNYLFLHKRFVDLPAQNVVQHERVCGTISSGDRQKLQSRRKTACGGWELYNIKHIKVEK